MIADIAPRVWIFGAGWLPGRQKRGLLSRVSPHRFRHGCATALLEAGADLRSIQILLGHASIQTTRIYTSVTTRNLTETIEKHHPLSRPAKTLRVPALARIRT